MRRSAGLGRRGPEGGFTLVELLIAVAILGIIGPALAQAVILGLKATNGTANRVAGSSAVANLNTYFFSDVQSADQVSTSAGAGCGTIPGVVLHFRWTDQNTSTDVFYAFDPATGGDQNLIRVKCAGTAAADRRIVGHLVHDPSKPEPVTQFCGPDPATASPCTVTPTAPAAVTLVIQSDPAAPVTDLTAFRRRPLP